MAQNNCALIINFDVFPFGLLHLDNFSLTFITIYCKMLYRITLEWYALMWMLCKSIPVMAAYIIKYCEGMYMKIKLAILEMDKNYLNRIVTSFGAKYAEELEIYSFTDREVALSTLEKTKIDVFIASDSFDIDVTKLPKRCGFAYFADSVDISTINNQRAICKFQKADLIYKQILSVYSEKAGSISGVKEGDGSSRVILFASPCGGVGTSSMAAACAMHFAAQGAKTLYLNMEKFGSSDVFFKAEGQFDMSDVIFALKSKKANLSIKLESCVKQAQSGVCFYSPTKVALDILELNSEDLMRLVSELKLAGAYDYIIIDTDFELNKNRFELCREAAAVVWVSDGSEMSNTKTVRAFEALNIMEQNAEYPIAERLFLVYNKFSNKTGQTIGDIGLVNIGGAPRYEHAGVEQVIAQLASMNMFDKLV